ncbi:MAG: DUF1127 domain-containing protein [Rhodopseudomonas palustris]|uniref:DUF1127 domain-containing protein n=1 Tax=Rhodopseudomonas palustris TaxID=1076 RepID=A0A933W3B7_RHOPL|nr:DUF1127 domain-containing protein [Rhodopseudomonas palustris]
MSTCTHPSMINHHGQSGLLSALRDTWLLWRNRSRERAGLARLSERDLHDIGLSWGEMLYEAEKPFWRS